MKLVWAPVLLGSSLFFQRKNWCIRVGYNEPLIIRSKKNQTIALDQCWGGTGIKIFGKKGTENQGLTGG